MWRLKGYIDTFGTTSRIKYLSNIHAFSIYEIVEPMLYISDLSVTEHLLIYFRMFHTRLSHNRLLIQNDIYPLMISYYLHYTLNLD